MRARAADPPDSIPEHPSNRSRQPSRRAHPRRSPATDPLPPRAIRREMSCDAIRHTCAMFTRARSPQSVPNRTSGTPPAVRTRRPRAAPRNLCAAPWHICATSRVTPRCRRPGSDRRHRSRGVLVCPFRLLRDQPRPCSPGCVQVCRDRLVVPGGRFPDARWSRVSSSDGPPSPRVCCPPGFDVRTRRPGGDRAGSRRYSPIAEYPVVQAGPRPQ